MYRYAIENLDKWKNSKNRKPLIIEGARQVGKTWIMKEFGKKSYNKTVYINFDSNVQMAELFSIDLNVERIVMIRLLYSMRFRKYRKHYHLLSTSMKMLLSIILCAPVLFLELRCTKEHHSPSAR